MLVKPYLQERLKKKTKNRFFCTTTEIAMIAIIQNKKKREKR